MGVLVVSEVLFLYGNVDCYLYSLADISNGSVEFECPLWLSRHVVSFTHEVVNQLVGQSVKLYLCHISIIAGIIPSPSEMYSFKALL